MTFCKTHFFTKGLKLARALLAPVLVRVLVPAFFVLWGAQSCGGIAPLHGKVWHENDPASLPNLKNFEGWRGLWIKHSWIVALKPNKPDSLDVARVRENVLAGLLQASGFEAQSQEYAALGAFLAPRLNIEMSIPRVADFSTPPEGQTLGFAFVSLPSSLLTLSAQFPGFYTQSWLPDGLRGDAMHSLAAWQMSALERLPDAAWVEPNLTSVLYENLNSRPALARTYEPPGELAQSGPQGDYMSDVIKRIKGDLAYKHVTENLGRELAPVNVAVLDTGVDHLHPELKDQMFRNENEVPDDNKDNDGNGYVDDIFGIDATIEKGKPDLSAAPITGTADLGGPGKSCPSPDVEDELIGQCGHGTHVAGIIAAKHGGDLRVLGVCPSCKIMSLRVADRCLMPATKVSGECVRPKDPLKEGEYEVDAGISDTSQIRALSYLFELRRKDRRDELLVNIVNMSLGKYFRSRSMSYLIKNLFKRNVIIVAAAGNENTDTPSYPAAYAGVVSVCATGSRGDRGEYSKASFSNFGDWVDICAPGSEITSTMPGTEFSEGALTFKSGTSQATPVVAGALGYMLSVARNSKSAKQLIHELKRASNSEILYNADFNKGLFLACYADGSQCDYLLGAGFLDLEGGVMEPVRENSKVGDTEVKAVNEGCVISSLGARGRTSFWSFFSSLPFVLVQFWLCLRLYRLCWARRCK